MSDLTQPITNPELAQAVADMAAQGSRASREAVLDIVISKARFLPPWSCGTTGRRALWWTPLAPACPSTGP